MKDLNFTKDKLYSSNDTSKWGINDADIPIQELVNLKHDKERAFTYMLPVATKEAEKLREEAEYFTNQVYREFKRNSAINYEIARSTVINIGEMLLRLTYQVSNGWQDLLKRYTGLNEERKAEDEKQLLLHANMKLEDFDFGNEIDTEDLPMFKELAEKTAKEADGIIVESSTSQLLVENQNHGKGRYTVAYAKMDKKTEGDLLSEPLLSQEEESKQN